MKNMDVFFTKLAAITLIVITWGLALSGLNTAYDALPSHLHMISVMFVFTAVAGTITAALGYLAREIAKA